MGKFNLYQKTLKSNLAVCILYHNNKIDLSSLLSSINNKQLKILLILDGLKKIKNQKKILKLHKNIIIVPLKKRGISFCRNYGLKYCIEKKIKLLIFLDSDVVAQKDIIENHYMFHGKYKKIPVIAGGVIPTFFHKSVNIFTKIDGILSWLGHIPERKERLVSEPYHLATINMSIKIDIIKKFRIFFDQRLETGEDIKFCKDVRGKGFKILKIPETNVIHKDRENFKEVIKHQAKWGAHQFYTIYKFNFLKLGNFFNILFLFLFPIFVPIISIIITLVSIYPWINKSLMYVRYIAFVYIFVIIKSFYTYTECYKDLLKNLKND